MGDGPPHSHAPSDTDDAVPPEPPPAASAARAASRSAISRAITRSDASLWGCASPIGAVDAKSALAPTLGEIGARKAGPGLDRRDARLVQRGRQLTARLAQLTAQRKLAEGCRIPLGLQRPEKARDRGLGGRARAGAGRGRDLQRHEVVGEERLARDGVLALGRHILLHERPLEHGARLCRHDRLHRHSARDGAEDGHFFDNWLSCRGLEEVAVQCKENISQMGLLHKAVLVGPEAVERTLKNELHGVAVDAADNNGCSALGVAVLRGCGHRGWLTPPEKLEAIILQLLAAGADPRRRPGASRFSPIEDALLTCNLPIIEAMQARAEVLWAASALAATPTPSLPHFESCVGALLFKCRLAHTGRGKYAGCVRLNFRSVCVSLPFFVLSTRSTCG